MPQAQRRRNIWWGLLVAVIVIGLLSRVAQTGFRALDKYLGDALYAAMVYIVLRLTNRISRVAVWAAATMTTIEFFQLTEIPAEMLRSGYAPVRVVARLLGTEFSVVDLLAYVVGIGCIAAFDQLAAARGSSWDT